MFFVNCVFENDMFILFLRIYDVIKIIMTTCFLLIAYLKMTYFIIFADLLIMKNNCDDMFFVNCVFENDMFILFLRIYDVIKIIMTTCFLLIAYLKMTYFIIFADL